MHPLRLTAAVLSCLLVTPGVAAASASTLLYERTLLAEADRRCDLFESPVSAALISARAQARGAALRASTAHVVRAIEGRALAKAANTPCDLPGLQTAAARVRSAYQGWSRINHMNFPGERAAWRADRTVTADARWRLVQNTRLGDQPAAFGLVGEGPAPARLTAIARFRERPAYVRLRLPDGRAYLAGGRGPAPKPLRPRGWGEPLAYRFPAAATAALESLDPRAVVRLEFVSPTRKGERTRAASIEVGDFAAAQAFLAMSSQARR